ncbi:extracellular serine rich protein [Aspergillus udagawae]|uniref:Extracellular membrane protein CFEM domain-containing protein n=1 Tax=Aspergillus udagawae TaxID=91492 RepID=A0A8E0QNA2_9EURO|nr:uncharacterized protein Aud_003583 [Aspergillus udagawae]GIC87202.1 hypothetical protein Aud_003583 [Aspergillus udagawae]
MVHTTSTTLLAITGLAATATAYQHTWRDHMECAAAVAQDADYPTCTSPSKFHCFCAQPFDPARVSTAAKDVCKGFGIPTESIHDFICDSAYDDVYDHDHDHYRNCHHAFVYDDGDNDRDRHRYPISHPHRLSQPMMRVAAPGTDSSDTAKHKPSVQSKRAYGPGLSPSASSSPSAYAHRPLVTDAPSARDEESDYENENENENEGGSRVITEILTHTSCDCSSSTVAAATGRASSSRPVYLHQSEVPKSTSSSAYAPVHQTVVPVPSSSSAHAHVHQTVVPVPSSSSSSAHAHVHQTVVPVASSTASSMLMGSGSHSSAPAHAPASVYVSVPVSVPEPSGVDAQRSGYPSRHKTMASSSMVPSASALPSPSHSAMTFDGGASAGVLVPRSLAVLGLTALMAFFM